MITKRSLMCTIAAACCVLSAAGAATAQTYPNRPVFMVVPLAAGGAADAGARILAPRLSELLGQQVLVENVTGAGGMIGTSRVAKAASDGYQFVYGTVGTHAYNQTLYKKLLYDAANDFTPVALFADSPLVLVVRKDLPVSNLSEFIAYAKLNQTKMQHGSAGTGSSTHLACELLNGAIGVSVTHVPYRSGGQVMQDLIADRIDYHCGNISYVLPQIESKALKAIAIVTGERAALMPAVATAREQGLVNFEASNWVAIFLPRRTPTDIVRKLHTATVAAMETPSVQERLNSIGVTMVTPERRSPEYLQGFVVREIEKWAGVIRTANINLE